ncbi:MAG TPA: hypothetical protein VF173_10785 [Thermoanaerobaculia bacterium]|nr:hypothetical protein [Thermoanaerobaculia bacterium]
MRRLLILAGLLIVVVLASTGMVPSAEATTCTTTCSNSTLSCTPTTSCSSVPGTSLTCDGVVTQCSAADPYCTCADKCEDDLDVCLANCAPSCNHCGVIHNLCLRQCGTKPPHTTC